MVAPRRGSLPPVDSFHGVVADGFDFDVAEDGVTEHRENCHHGEYAAHRDHYRRVTMTTPALGNHVISADDFYNPSECASLLLHQFQR